MVSQQQSGLTVSFRGVRGSIPAPGFETARYGGNTACVELRCGEEILILDAGSGIRKLGDDLAKEFGSLSIAASVLISHTHWDHIQGLSFFAPLYAPQNRIRIFGANSDAFALERALHNQMQPLHFPVALEEMRGLAGIGFIESGRTELGEFQIEKIALNHPGGCAGFRIEARGASTAFLPDHEPYRYSRNGTDGANDHPAREALLRFLHGVDLLILDAQYTESEYRRRVGWGHGCLTDSVALAVEAGVRQLRFFHHDPSHSDDQIDEMVREGRRLAGSAAIEIDAAAENQSLTLEPRMANGDSSGHLLPANRNGGVNSTFSIAARRKVSFRRAR